MWICKVQLGLIFNYAYICKHFTTLKIINIIFPPFIVVPFYSSLGIHWSVFFINEINILDAYSKCQRILIFTCVEFSNNSLHLITSFLMHILFCPYNFICYWFVCTLFPGFVSYLTNTVQFFVGTGYSSV